MTDRLTTPRSFRWASVCVTALAIAATPVAAQFGSTISFPVPLVSNAFSDTGDDGFARLLTDAAGNWIAVWHSQDPMNGTIGPDADIVVSLSNDNGTNWTVPAPLNSNARLDTGGDFLPSAATDRAGNWIVIWQSDDTLNGSIRDDLDILIARSDDNGLSWSLVAALNLNANTDSGSDAEPHLATDAAGNWVAVWSSNESLGGLGSDDDIFVARSADNGATWTFPVALNFNATIDAGDDQMPRIITDRAGNWITFWQSNENLVGALGTDFDIFFSVSTDNGATWTFPAALNNNANVDAGHDFVPRPATDTAGNWLVVWQSDDDRFATIGTDNDILYARSSNAGASWSNPAPLNTNAVTDTGDDFLPFVATDRAGNWVTAWFSTEPLVGAAASDSDVFVARSADNGATWTAPRILNTNATTDTGEDLAPHLATDGMGNWFATWSSTEPLGGVLGDDFDILLARFSLPDTGSTSPAAGCGACGALGMILYPFTLLAFAAWRVGARSRPKRGR